MAEHWKSILKTLNCPPWRQFSEKPGRSAIFGASGCGESLCRALTSAGIDVTCFLDNRAIGRDEANYKGLEVHNPAEINSLDIDHVLIGSMFGVEMTEQLRRLGYAGKILDLSTFYLARWVRHFDQDLLNEESERIAQARAILSDEKSRLVFDSLLTYRRTLSNADLASSTPQYSHQCASIRRGDVVLDGGAYDGAETLVWAREVGEHGSVHAFEPMEKNYSELAHNVGRSGLINAHIWNLALWNRSGIISFEIEDAAEQSRVDANGACIVNSVCIDDFVARQCLQRIDMIKMDIEGAEIAALEGAKCTFKAFRPRLAIACYHMPSDLWAIPLFVWKTSPNCDIFVEHHSQNLLDTVCYVRPM